MSASRNIRKRPKQTTAKEAVLELLRTRESMTTRELAQLMPQKRFALSSALADLCERNMIERLSLGVYRLIPEREPAKPVQPKIPVFLESSIRPPTKAQLMSGRASRSAPVARGNE